MGRTASILLALAACLCAPGADRADEEPPPRQIGLIERSESQLAQIDFTVFGDPETVRALRPEDFKVKVGFRKLRSFTLDRVCSDVTELPAAEAPRAVRRVDGPSPTGAHYVLYFDQAHLTLGGRQSAFGIARQLIDRLVEGGSRATLISNSGELEVMQSFTDDPALLHAALDRLTRDRRHLDMWAEKEDLRVRELVGALDDTNNTSVQRAVGVARRHQREESARAQRSLRRLGYAVRMLADTPQPKALVLFADTLRSNAGEHYVRMFGSSFLARDATLIGGGTMMAALPFDEVVHQAAALGVRFYTVKADGLSYSLDRQPSSGAQAVTYNAMAASPTRHHHAQDTLANLASETGGRAFPFGIDGARLADAIADDLRCVFLISFDPSRYSEDNPLPVKITTKVPGVRVHGRGRIVIQSAEERDTSRLLGAFITPERGERGFGLGVELVSLGYDEGHYRALLQVRLPALPLPSSSWEIAASFVESDRVRHESTGSVRLPRPDVALIHESEIELAPGDYEVTVVARELTTDVIESRRIELSLPSLRRGANEALVPALLQPEPTLFLRDGETRAGGSLARTALDAVDPERPTALLGIVCRSERVDEALTVERALTGSHSVAFPPITLDPDDSRCIQVRDVVPAGTLAPGAYRYDLSLTRDGKKLSSSERSFTAAAPR